METIYTFTHTSRYMMKRLAFVRGALCPLLFGLMFISLSGCSGSSWTKVPKYEMGEVEGAATLNEFAWDRTPSDAVAPGFLIGLSSVDPVVNGEFRIEHDYTLKLPYEVKIPTNGLSESELRTAIQKAYVNYFRSPGEVKVKVLKREYLIDVQGLVKKPGQYPLRQNASIDEVIAQAGGLDETGSEKVRYVQIKTETGSGIIELADYHSGAKALTPTWHGGETLFFQTQGVHPQSSGSNNIVRVLGQVKNPAEFTATKQSTFFTYLVKAGGPTDRADMGNVTVIRNDNDQTRALTFNSNDFGSIPPIVPGDTIIVNAENPSPLEKKTRIGANIASVLTAIGIIVIAGM